MSIPGTIHIPKRRLHAILATLFSFLLIFTVAVIVILARGGDSTEPMRALADRFTPPTGSKLIGERVVSPNIFCAGRNVCPSLTRHWTGTKNLTVADLQQIGADFGDPNVYVHLDCTPHEDTNVYGPETLCEFNTTRGGYIIKFYQGYDSQQPEQYGYYLSLEPASYDNGYLRW